MKLLVMIPKRRFLEDPLTAGGIEVKVFKGDVEGFKLKSHPAVSRR